MGLKWDVSDVLPSNEFNAPYLFSAILMVRGGGGGVIYHVIAQRINVLTQNFKFNFRVHESEQCIVRLSDTASQGKVC